MPKQKNKNEIKTQNLSDWLAFTESTLLISQKCLSSKDDVEFEVLYEDFKQHQVILENNLIQILIRNKLISADVCSQKNDIHLLLENLLTDIRQQCEELRKEIKDSKDVRASIEARYLKAVESKNVLLNMFTIISEDSSELINLDQSQFDQLVELMQWTHKLAEKWEVIRDIDAQANDSLLLKAAIGAAQLLSGSNTSKHDLKEVIEKRIIALTAEENRSRKEYVEINDEITRRENQFANYQEYINGLPRVSGYLKRNTGLIVIAATLKNAQKNISEVDEYIKSLSVRYYTQSKFEVNKTVKEFDQLIIDTVRKLSEFEVEGNPAVQRIGVVLNKLQSVLHTKLQDLSAVAEETEKCKRLRDKADTFSALISANDNQGSDVIDKLDLLIQYQNILSEIGNVDKEIDVQIIKIRANAQAALDQDDIDKLANSMKAKKQQLVVIKQMMQAYILQVQTWLIDLDHKKRWLTLLNGRNKIGARGNMSELLELFTQVEQVKGLLSADYITLVFLEYVFRNISELYTEKKFNLGKDSIANVIAVFIRFLYECKPSDAEEKWHRKLIYILVYLKTIGIDLDVSVKKTIQQLLNFEHALDSSDRVYSQILTCARVGIDIREAVELVVKKRIENTSEIITENPLNKRNLSELIYACFIHDANSGSGNKLPSEIVKTIIKNIEQNYEEELIEKSSKSAYIKQTVFEESKKEESKKRAADASDFVRAAQYYRYPLSKRLLAYISSLLSYDKSTTIISFEQRELYNILVANLSSCQDQLVIKLEHSDLKGFSCDIHIFNTKTQEHFDVEYDGLDLHYYKLPDFTVIKPLRLMREYCSRDEAMKNNGFQVVRFTSVDIISEMSEKLSLFIEKMKATTLASSYDGPGFSPGRTI